MTAITRNLPWFVKDLGISIVGKKCYTSIVEDLDFSDVECLKYGLSKGLGLGIVAGGSIMKVPQILLILKASSARGLSLSAYVLETLSYAITTFYSFRHDFPFSTYGENFFLTVQNVIITLLLIAYPSPLRVQTNTSSKLFVGLAATAASAGALYTLPKETLALLQFSTLPLSVFSKLPQITQNRRSQSTGQLSAFAVISQIFGCLARLFTTATEVGDTLLSAGFAVALLLNCILGAQMYMYWGRDDLVAPAPRGSLAEKEREKPEMGTWGVQETSSVPASPSTKSAMQANVGPQPAGRKWARKVD